MNYRHAFHAGSHADVVKHVILSLAIEHLKKKQKSFLVIDAHAGRGLYSLGAAEASRTLEWREGVGRFYGAKGETIELAPRAEKLLAPWRRIVEAVNESGDAIRWYPGSPEIFRRLIRRSDRLLLNELHPEDQRALVRRYASDARIRVLKFDAERAIKGSLPPKERRGLILVDPPYEKMDEVKLALKMLKEGHRRFATGVFFLWYPITGDGLSDRLIAMVKSLELAKALNVKLMVRRAVREGGLAGAGLVIVNPPWPLEEELGVVLPALARQLSQGEGAKSTLAWLSGDGRA